MPNLTSPEVQALSAIFDEAIIQSQEDDGDPVYEEVDTLQKICLSFLALKERSNSTGRKIEMVSNSKPRSVQSIFSRPVRATSMCLN